MTAGSFTSKNWLSSNRSLMFNDRLSESSDTLGYDMKYYDETGILGKGTKQYYIEVKGHISTQPYGFYFTENENKVSAQVSQDSNSLYIIIGVSVYPNPQILYWLENPSQLQQNNQITLTPSTYLATNFPRWVPLKDNNNNNNNNSTGNNNNNNQQQNIGTTDNNNFMIAPPNNFNNALQSIAIDVMHQPEIQQLLYLLENSTAVQAQLEQQTMQQQFTDPNALFNNNNNISNDIGIMPPYQQPNQQQVNMNIPPHNMQQHHGPPTHRYPPPPPFNNQNNNNNNNNNNNRHSNYSNQQFNNNNNRPPYNNNNNNNRHPPRHQQYQNNNNNNNNNNNRKRQFNNPNQNYVNNNSNANNKNSGNQQYKMTRHN